MPLAVCGNERKKNCDEYGRVLMGGERKKERERQSNENKGMSEWDGVREREEHQPVFVCMCVCVCMLVKTNDDMRQGYISSLILSKAIKIMET